MKKGRKGRQSNGAWAQEPRPETQKQIDAGTIVRKSAEGGYVLAPRPLIVGFMARLEAKETTKKAATMILQERLKKTYGAREKKRLEAILEAVKAAA